MNLAQYAKKWITPITLFILAIIVVFHQYLICGIWWQPEDIHHEAFIIALVFGGIVLYSVKRKLW